MTDRARSCTCGKPVHDSDVVCKACIASTRRHLTNQASYHDSLTTELARMTDAALREQPPHSPGCECTEPWPALDGYQDVVPHA